MLLAAGKHQEDVLAFPRLHALGGIAMRNSIVIIIFLFITQAVLMGQTATIS